MKAIIFPKYGSPDVLQFKEIEKPTPNGDQVLVKVHAASINDWDWALLDGTPLVTRLLFGLLRPKMQILGCDVAGRVEAIGANVKSLRPGNDVFGDISSYGFGAFAEYVCAPEKALTLKPASMTFAQAAAIPQAAMLAVQGLRDAGNIRLGQRLLINGAGGGVGTFALQIAKQFEVEVTAVDRAEKLDMLRSMGADHVIDFMREDFTESCQRYDLILDVKTNRPIFQYARVLKPNGTYVTVGGSMVRLFQAMFLRPWFSWAHKKNIRIVVLKPNKDLAYMKELFESGKMRPVIDKSFRLCDVPDALRYFGQGHHKGKVIIDMEQN